MNALESKLFTYHARVTINEIGRAIKPGALERSFPIHEELCLKRGANVMMVANDPEHRWVNGTLGVVDKLSDDGIRVAFGIGRKYDISPREFEEQEITYKDGNISYKTVYAVSQYPLVPAYAITIHKSQGQTYRNVVCDIKECFANGQAYVALSRCASLEGLHLQSKITEASITVNRDVLAFYHELQQHSLLHEST